MLKKALIDWGFQNSSSDDSLFFCWIQGKLLLVLVYVDNILLTEEDATLVAKLILDLNSQFTLKTLGFSELFLGVGSFLRRYMNFAHSEEVSSYNLLVKTKMIEAKACSTPMCQNKKLSLTYSILFENPSVYRSTIWALQYPTLTRPDVAFAVNKLSQFLQAPTVEHWSACKEVVKVLERDSRSWCYVQTCF